MIDAACQGKIAYLGPQWSFSHLCFEKTRKLLSQTTIGQEGLNFADIFEFATNGADNSYLALLPIENSLGGNVSEVYDLLVNKYSSLKVVAEYVMPICHQLVSTDSDISMSGIREIRGHQQALWQCRDTISRLYKGRRTDMPVLTPYPSNSAAAQSLFEEPASVAAICAFECALANNLHIVQSDIQDNPHNLTRFWVLSQDQNIQASFANSNQWMISIAFQIPRDMPGGLSAVLAPISMQKLNLSKILSIPTRGQLCEYTFVIDIVLPFGSDRNKVLASLTDLITQYTSHWRLLGLFPVHPSSDQRFSCI